MGAAERLSTAWLLAGEFGATMTEAQFRAKFTPKDSDKTFKNKLSAGTIPAMRGQVFDVQDVAAWWDALAPRR